MNCPICEHNEWTDVSQYRVKKEDKDGKKIDMSMCSHCGFVTYPSRCVNEKELIEYYKSAYRAAPNSTNLFTGEKKLQFHEFFLRGLIEEWKKLGIKPVVGEIGSAYGIFLNWLRQQLPCEIHGTELTTSFKRVAFHEFGIKLEDELPKLKYDFLASYHVLEHLINPHEKMLEYRELLADNGVFYLSCPVWFKEAGNGSQGGFDIENYWAPDHINSWSEEHLEWIFKKTGYEIIFKNDDIYGNTYLLKKVSLEKHQMPDFNPAKYKEAIKNIFTCWMLIQEKKHAEAIAIYPNCPAAWINNYEFNRAKLHKSKDALDKYLLEAVKNCPTSSDILLFVGDIFTRYERYDESYDYLSRALAKKINSPTILFAMSNCMRMKAVKETNIEKKNKFLRESINILRFIMSLSSESLSQAISWSYHDQALLEIPSDSSHLDKPS